MTETRILTFAGARGDLLTARLDLPDRKPNAVVLVAHCFGGGNAGPAAAQMARGFAKRDMAVLSLDFGAADGEADGHVVSLGADDLAIAVGQLRSAVAAPDILLGHSRAGAAILAVAGEVPEARAVVTVGTPADGVRLASPGQLSGPELHQRIASLRRALLITHAPGDQVVDIDQARILFEAARHPKSFMSLDGADHQLTRPADAAYAASIIAAWAARYLPTSESTASESTASESTGGGTPPPATARLDEVVVTESQARPYGQRIIAGRHQLTADEPAAVGGADSGPTPYDLLLAGLGACTAITVRMYADRRGWPLRHVTVRLRHRRIHAKDCADCATGTGQLDHIERELQFAGELTGEHRARLLEIAERCPVHRTLHSEVLVSTAEGA